MQLTAGERTLITIALLMGAAFSLQSAYLGYNLLRPVQFWDQIASVAEYLVFMDGNFGLKSLVRLHNEHRIATSRILFLVDALYFEFSNRFLISFIYAALFAITTIIAALAQRVRTAASVVVITIIGLGIGWSISQHENLSWGFQTQFPLVHLFAIACIACFIKVLEETASIWRCVWFALAVTTDALGILSSAGGLLIGIAAVAICIWQRRITLWVVLFVAAHFAMMAMYLDGVPHNADTYAVGLRAMVVFFAKCLAAVLRTDQDSTWVFGCLIGGTAAAVTLRYAWRRRANDPPSSLLLALALFIILETAATAFGRASTGADQALNSRYATQSAILVMTLLAFCWRASTSPVTRSLIIATSIAVIILANGRRNITEWRDDIATRDSAMLTFVAGLYPPAQLRAIFNNRPELVEEYYRRLAKNGSGPFALSAEVYRPPLNTARGLDLASLATCRGSIDLREQTEKWLEIRGWIASAKGETPSWVLAYSTDDTLVGYTILNIRRPDVVKVFPMFGERTGFDLFIPGYSPDTLKLVGLFDGPARACTL